jgi:hypothetical protein
VLEDHGLAGGGGGDDVGSVDGQLDFDDLVGAGGAEVDVKT